MRVRGSIPPLNAVTLVAGHMIMQVVLFVLVWASSLIAVRVCTLPSGRNIHHKINHLIL